MPRPPGSPARGQASRRRTPGDLHAHPTRGDHHQASVGQRRGILDDLHRDQPYARRGWRVPSARTPAPGAAATNAGGSARSRARHKTAAGCDRLPRPPLPTSPTAATSYAPRFLLVPRSSPGAAVHRGAIISIPRGRDRCSSQDAYRSPCASCSLRSTFTAVSRG